MILGKSFIKLYGNDYNITTSGRTGNLENKHIYMDLEREIDFDKFPKNIDTIIYLAQSYNFRDFPNSSNDIFTINTVRVLDFLNYSRNIGIKHFIYASTGGVYTQDKINQEDDFIDTTKLNGFYATSKYCTELLVNSYKDFFDTVILRPFFMFGINQKKDMLIPRLVENIKTNKEIILQGEEGIYINPIYVNDAAKALNKIILNNLTGIYNLAGDETVSIRQLSEIIGKLLGIKPIFRQENNITKNLLANNKKIRHSNYSKLEISLKELIYNEFS